MRWMAAWMISVAVAACGGDSKQVATDTARDTSVRDTIVAVDTAGPAGTRCCPLGNCPLHTSCFEGACLPSTGVGECYSDGQCRPGQRCEGATACACGELDCEPVVGTCRYPEGCCQRTADCDAGEVCYEGRCEGAPGQGQCWTSDHCEAGEACEAVTSCPCGTTGCEAKPGHCGLAGVCCLTDLECRGGVCRGGRCVETPTEGACFGDGDCPVSGEICRGEALCPCGAEGDCKIPTTAGRCGPAAGGCCDDASDCGAGELCVEGKGCVAEPKGEECWVDGHCGIGRVCDDPTVCDCAEDDNCTATPGTCRTTAPTCKRDADCAVGMRCTIPDQAWCPGAPDPTEGVCVEEVDVGCWGAADCNPYIRCSGETVCMDPAGCAAPNNPGECREKAILRDCCDSHNGCETGTECRNSNSSLTCPPNETAVCLRSPRYGLTCWNNDDCTAGKVCNFTWICGCNAKCRWSAIGACEEPTFCQHNLDCGTEEICARDPECILSPCTTSSTCHPGGRCQPHVEGRCWTHDECGAGEYCEGLQVCEPGRDCLAADSPGLCEPTAGLGECCTSYRGCDGGLRCVSVGQRTGCVLDVTSVCVPAITSGIDCYADDDCQPDQRCEGATVCPCGVASCSGDPVAGACVGEL